MFSNKIRIESFVLTSYSSNLKKLFVCEKKNVFFFPDIFETINPFHILRDNKVFVTFKLLFDSIN